MARIRSIKPSFWTDEKLTLLPREVRLTYIGLISHADDEGRLKGDLRLVKAAVYPLDDDMTAEAIEKHLARLAKAGRITRYRAGGAAYIAIPTFRAHQRISHPLKSDLPAPDPAPIEDARKDCGGPAEDVRSDCGGSVSGLEVEVEGEREVEVEGDARARATDPAPADADAPCRRPDEHDPAKAPWIAEGVAWWAANVGRVTPRVFRRELGGSVEAHDWGAVFRGLQCYVSRGRKRGAALRLDWFASEDARWIAEAAEENRVIGANGNEAEIMAWVAANPPQRTAGAGGAR